MGLAGSLHCAGMCSPLAMAVTRLSRPLLFNKILYNVGRIVTYGVLGASVGMLGSVLDFSAAQRFVSIVLGAALIAAGAAGISSVRIPVLTPLIIKITGRLKHAFGKFLAKRDRGATLMLGVLNGLLPCGLTYLALAVSLTTGHAFNGFLYMVLFGVGTLPVMIGLPLVFQKLAGRFTIRKINTALLIVAGVLLIARNFIPLHTTHMARNTPSMTVESDPVICK